MITPTRFSLSVKERKQLRFFLEQGAPGPKAALRASILLLSGASHSSQDIACLLKISPRTVRGCRHRWRTQGLSGLRDAPRSGRPKLISSSFVRLLIRTTEEDPRRLGYVFSRWTNPRLATYLAQKTGIQVSPKWIGELLHQHGFVWGRSKLTTQNLADPGEKKTG